jgi:N6-L-threonylcarbamoyladenine synthase
LEQFLRFIPTIQTPKIDAIAVTIGPGLEPALWVGVNFAKTLATFWNKPIVGVNHMEGHVVISMIRNDDGNGVQVIGSSENTKTYSLFPITFPLLSLLISGGHTELVLSREWMQYELVGQTRDDAVGEAFDKVARLMGLPYPGGPEISKLATEMRRLEAGLPSGGRVRLPRPMIDSNNFDFSFAGLKTAVRNVVEAEELTEERKKLIALEFENACADVLVAKTMRAIEEFGAETVVVGGGVSANTHIRASLAQAIKDYGLGTKLLIPLPSLATDNALMIALAGYFRAQRGEYAAADSIRAQGNLKLF